MYVGRPTMFGNPFIHNDQDEVWVKLRHNGEYIEEYFCEQTEEYHSVSLFAYYLRKPMHKTKNLTAKSKVLLMNHFLNINANIGRLTGKNLACWCGKDDLCHADVLMEAANDVKTK